MHDASLDFKEKLRKYVVRGERRFNEVFVVILQGILKGVSTRCSRDEWQHSSLRAAGPKRSCWERLSFLGLRLPTAPRPLFPDRVPGGESQRGVQTGVSPSDLSVRLPPFWPWAIFLATSPQFLYL